MSVVIKSKRDRCLTALEISIRFNVGFDKFVSDLDLRLIGYTAVSLYNTIDKKK